MINKIFIVVLSISFFEALGQEESIDDGPYIFIEEAQLISKNIMGGKVLIEALSFDSYDTSYIAQQSTFSGVENIVALSDIHGQYDLAVEILQNNQIIDENLNWNFGTGHMVIAGDIFDRGPKVTEVLWLVYKLEKQAKEAGGFVHFLLGNHEYMVLHKDLRYLHAKYENVSTLLEKNYDELFGNNTILGRWLRSKPTVIQINKHVFVHGGISNDFISSVGFDIEAINETMRKSIDRSKEEMKASDFYRTYYGSSGPIWYRGYFYGDLSDQAIDSVLDRTNSEHLVVGHCSNDEVVSLFANKVFGVDSSIKKGRYGEVLFLTTNGFFKGTKNGERLKFE
ncbi:metallophosphoesterase [Ekhidna sp.]|uniref:metallophosphoesterase n=1 Tax=Ekhidna sp. TaxID=2608089 RepID=UPI003299DE48